MDNRTTIITELQAISPLVAGIPPVNPYFIPEGYFTVFANMMLELNREPGSVVLASRAMPYSVPENYFENFPANMLDRVIMVNIPSVTPNPYQIPDGYFESLPNIILNRVKGLESSAKDEIESISPLLSGISKKVPFSTPEGYFDDLTENVVSGTQAIQFVNEELESSAILSALKTKNAYSVPTGYFESFPQLMLQKAKSEQRGKVVSISFGRKAMRYAAAAVVTGLIVLAGFFYFNQQPVGTTLAQADEKLKQETQKNLQGFSDNELLNYIENEESVLPEPLLMASGDIDTEDVKYMLADVSEEGLEEFLAKYAEGNEPVTN